MTTNIMTTGQHMDMVETMAKDMTIDNIAQVLHDGLTITNKAGKEAYIALFGAVARTKEASGASWEDIQKILVESGYFSDSTAKNTLKSCKTVSDPERLEAYRAGDIALDGKISKAITSGTKEPVTEYGKEMARKAKEGKERKNAQRESEELEGKRIPTGINLKEAPIEYTEALLKHLEHVFTIASAKDSIEIAKMVATLSASMDNITGADVKKALTETSTTTISN